MIDDSETMVEVINRWQSEGFGANFRAERPVDVVMLRCGICNDDEAVAFALRCVHCGTRGILVAAYGPNASADEAAAIVALQDGRPRG